MVLFLFVEKAEMGLISGVQTLNLNKIVKITNFLIFGIFKTFANFDIFDVISSLHKNYDKEHRYLIEPLSFWLNSK